jgi:hypothetical protein
MSELKIVGGTLLAHRARPIARWVPGLAESPGCVLLRCHPLDRLLPLLE